MVAIGDSSEMFKKRSIPENTTAASYKVKEKCYQSYAGLLLISRWLHKLASFELNYLSDIIYKSKKENRPGTGELKSRFDSIISSISAYNREWT